RWLAAETESDLLRRLLSQLGGEYRDVGCLDGRTGGELLAEWRNDPQRTARIDAVPAWPTEQMTVEEHSQNLPPQLVGVRHLGAVSPLLAGWTFSTDAAGTKLVAFDQLGRHRWQMPTTSTGVLQGRRGASYIRYITTAGRYLLLVVEDQWTLVDVFGSANAPTVLGGKRLYAAEDSGSFIQNLPRLNQPGRNRNRTWTDPQGGVSPLGNVGPIAGGMFVYQSGSRLTAVSVSTGEELWTHDRPDLPPGGDIVSDEHCVVVWPTGSTELQLFRAVDGSEIGRRKLPRNVALPQPEGYWGSSLVTVSRGIDGSLLELGLFDPLAQRHVWQRSLNDVTDWGVVDGREFYTLQKDGTLRILDHATGADIVSLSLSDSAPEAVTVWGDADRWYAATYVTPPDDRIILESQLPQSPGVHGVVLAASRATGKLEWRVPVQYQQLHRELPGGWPMLVLASQVHFPARTEPERKSSRIWNMLLLEKSTGRVLYETTAGSGIERYGWTSNPEQHTIDLAAGAIKVSLQFDKPAPQPVEPPQPNPDGPSVPGM
ncbi:MAG: hypothetical protein JNG89_08115, partial [Planctomycetaceae bacterium]|nr:hypothetical protein [Planctomycetaceae bacterium]